MQKLESGISNSSATEVLAKNALLAVISRFSIGVIAAVLIWQFLEVKNSLKEVHQVANTLQIVAARIEERDAVRGIIVADIQQRLRDTEQRVRHLSQP